MKLNTMSLFVIICFSPSTLWSISPNKFHPFTYFLIVSVLKNAMWYDNGNIYIVQCLENNNEIQCSFLCFPLTLHYYIVAKSFFVKYCLFFKLLSFLGQYLSLSTFTFLWFEFRLKLHLVYFEIVLHSKHKFLIWKYFWCLPCINYLNPRIFITKFVEL